MNPNQNVVKLLRETFNQLSAETAGLQVLATEDGRAGSSLRAGGRAGVSVRPRLPKHFQPRLVNDVQ